MSFKFEPTALVEYSTASKLARTYADEIVKVREAIATLADSINSLNSTFTPESSRQFQLRLQVDYSTNGHKVTEDETAIAVEAHLHRAAWRVLINKLGIRRMMSSKRAKQLDDLLEKGEVINEQGKREVLPPINEETIIGVIMSFVDSAESFLDEAIREEYDYWKPSPTWTGHKTNAKHTFKLERKLIKTYAFSVWRWAGKNDLGILDHDTQRHLTALDNIMHMLDGKGQISGYCGPLVDGISAAEKSSVRTVATEYFDAKWFSNGNLHLAFTRQDLLDNFNQICGRNRIAAEAA